MIGRLVCPRENRVGAVAVAASVVMVVMIVSLAVAGGASANWERYGGSEERENFRRTCAALDESCGGFCAYRQCLQCSDCRCFCCAALSDNFGCWCSAACECWEEGEGEEVVEVCDDPFLWTFGDCGLDCIEWEWRLHAFSSQPGRGDGITDNPYEVEGLGTALIVRGQSYNYDGVGCEEEGVSGRVTPVPVAVAVAPDEEYVVSQRQDDAEIGLPAGMSFIETSYRAEVGSVRVTVGEEVEGSLGRFAVHVSGVPAGHVALYRYWLAGAGVRPSADVPFRVWSSGQQVFLKRGWQAVQGAYVDVEGTAVGWSAVRVFWSNGPTVPAADVWAPSVFRPTSLPMRADGLSRPGTPALGVGVVNAAEPDRVLFSVSARPSGTVMQYRVWESTGRVPGTGPLFVGHGVWRTFTAVGGQLSLPRRGVIAFGGGYMAVQIRLYRIVMGELVESEGSVVRTYWVEPEGGGWVEVRDPVDFGEAVWRGPSWSLFSPPAMTPMPSLEGVTRPGRLVLGQVRRLGMLSGYVRVVVVGRDSGVSLQYRLWQATGAAPHGAEAVWENFSTVSGTPGQELVFSVRGRRDGGLGQWMSVQVRQVRGSGASLVAGEPSSVVTFRYLPRMQAP